MESSKKKSGGVEIPKRKRSLDLKGDCESQISKGGKKRKVSRECDQVDVKKTKRKKIPKEVPLSSFLSDAKKNRGKNGGSGSKLELGSKSGARRKGLHSVSLPLGENGNPFHIPKRPRGSVGRRRRESDQASQFLRLSSSVDCVGSLKEVTKSDIKVCSSPQSVSLVALSVGNNDIFNSRIAEKGSRSNIKRKKTDSKSAKDSSSSNVRLKQKVGDEVKKKRNRHVVKQENRSLTNGDASRKKTDLCVGRYHFEASSREPVPTAHSTVSISLSTNALDDEDDEDDEENLQRNAARMLSSRFDPSCTGYSSKRKSAVSPMANELFGNSISLNVESTAGDDNMRSLRPKRGYSNNGLSRKRRHFYEVLGRDVDPLWVLKRKIKIFWPLDGSWYDGIVNDYSSKTKLHHIKYSDRDEEWVNLEEESFKLLLLRSEVPGKVKSQNHFPRDKDLHIEIVPPPDDESSIGNSLDSKPIALWLATQSQSVKALPKSRKRLKTSESNLPFISSLASEKTDAWNDDVDGSEITGNKTGCECASADTSLSFEDCDKSLLGIISKSDKHLVYVRKKNQMKFAGSSYVLGDAKACGCAQEPATHALGAFCLPTRNFDTLNIRHINDDKELWVGDNGKLQYRTFLESKEFRLQICLLPCLKFSCGGVSFWVLHDIYWLQHGVIATSFHSVLFEMLLIDSNLGLRFLLYEGCLKQALAIVFDILSVFYQYNEQWNSDKELPATSIRFKFSSVHDRRKQHVFTAHCFSKLPRSMWHYLELKSLQQCLTIEQLCCSECTDDKMKEFESRVGFKLSSREDTKKKLERQREACDARMNQSPISLAAETTKVSHSPLYVLSLHLHSLMDRSLAHANFQHQDGNCSQELAEQKCDPPISQCAHYKLNSVTVEDVSSEHEIRQSDADDFVLNSSRTGSKSSSKRGKSIRISSPLGINSPVWSSGKPNFKPNFMPGPKKPRTQVQYTLPLDGYDISRKQEMPSSGSLPCKRIRRASLRRTSDVLGNNEKNMELLACSVNVLVTNEDRGWRECGGHVFLEISIDNEWRLVVKFSGVMRFSYKVKHILQPGSANRYSHAMMWKGGKNWVLEFPERDQWMLFKEMYEECYNRNVRAASMKNIPIPGVRLVDEHDDCVHKAPFVRNPAVYFRQIQCDAEFAMDPSRLIYDMDSDDERWLMEQKNYADKHKPEQLSDNFLEMTMDMFEKVSYAQHREDFTVDEVEALAADVGSVETAKRVYQHWRRKREKMCMPLIRHFQPPPWDRYQRQLKEWEEKASHGNGSADKEKPPMFAFCLKPRGLDVSSRGSKQRSHRKFTVSGNHHPLSGDRDTSLVYGRRPNGHAFGGKVLYTNSIHEVSDIPLYPSTRAWSPQNSHFSSTTIWKVNRKVSKNKHKRLISHLYSHGQQPPMGHENGVRTWDFKQLDISNLDEFHLRDALGAAQHTCKMARFKRDEAQRLLYKADLAIHRAVSSLINAEAMKDSFENLDGVS